MNARVWDMHFHEDTISENVRPLDTEEISVCNACGRILAMDICEEVEIWDSISDTMKMESKILVHKGSTIGPVIQGGLLVKGYETITVYRKPMVGFFYIKSEDQNNSLREECHRFVLSSAVKSTDVSVISHGKNKKDVECFAKDFRMAVATYDTVVFSTGSDLESFEMITSEISKSNVKIFAEQMDIEPGGNVFAAQSGSVPVFCISGSPVDVLTGFALAVKPILAKISGSKDWINEKIMVELDKDIELYQDVSRVIWGHLDMEDGIVRMRTKDEVEDESLWSLQDTNVLAVLPVKKGILKKGTLVDAYRIK